MTTVTSTETSMYTKETDIMIKEIRMASSKYTIEYDPEKQWDYHIKRYDEDVSDKLMSNVLNDIVFYLTENIEKGVALEGITVTEK